MKNDNINILGTLVSTLNKKNVLKKIELFLSSQQQHHITTPNPEFILNAQKDEEFFFILNNSDLAIPDGVGLKFAGFFAGKNIKRITGADIIYDICSISEKMRKPIFLLGGSDGSEKVVAKKLKKLYPKLKIVGAEEGLKEGEWEIKYGKWIRGENINKNLLEKINHTKPNVIFVAFGGSTKQEKWIYHNLKSIPSVKLAIGIGGAFDFISGKVKRAPKIFRIIGMEWLWRLIKQPRRWKRIFNAVVIFPLVFIKWKFILPFFYRPNVACMLYKKDGDNYKILLVKRSNEENHWQLPQGGTDGENIEIAGARELREELNTDKFKIIKTFKNLHKYKFGKRIGEYTDKAKRNLGHKGQKQNLVIAEFIGSDEDVEVNFWDHDNWKWVDSNNIINEVHKVRREANKIFINKFNQIIN